MSETQGIYLGLDGASENLMPSLSSVLPHTPIRITPAMMAAGRSAFLRKRRKLDDLFDYFDADLQEFLRHIYREMARAA